MNSRLDDFIKTSQKPSAILLVESPCCLLTSFIIDYCLSLFSFDDEVEKQNITNKIKSLNYNDLILLDGSGTEGVKKEDIIEIQSRFHKSGIEKPNIKIYVIKNIDKVNKSSLNSLLKFIEDSPENTYAIFTTRNYQNVLPTIVSRANTLFLSSDKNKLDKVLLEANVERQDYEFFANYYYDIDEASAFANGDYHEWKNVVNKLVNLKKDPLSAHSYLATFKKLDRPIIKMLIMWISTKVNPLNKENYLQILEDNDYNMSKSITFYKLIESLRNE